jgi:hypothetical protein
MAILTRVNGSLKPVMNVDVGSYTNGSPDANLVTDDATVNLMGPKMDFFTVDAGAVVTANQMAAAVQTVQQLATIYMYNADLANGEIALAVYPTGAYTAATLQSAIQNLGLVVDPVGLLPWATATAAVGATFV